MIPHSRQPVTTLKCDFHLTNATYTTVPRIDASLKWKITEFDDRFRSWNNLWVNKVVKQVDARLGLCLAFLRFKLFSDEFAYSKDCYVTVYRPQVSTLVRSLGNLRL